MEGSPTSRTPSRGRRRTRGGSSSGRRRRAWRTRGAGDARAAGQAGGGGVGERLPEAVRAATRLLRPCLRDRASGAAAPVARDGGCARMRRRRVRESALGGGGVGRAAGGER